MQTFETNAEHIFPFSITLKNNVLRIVALDFIGEQVGLDMEQFATCMEDPSILAGITSDINAANKVGVSGTPSIFISGLDADGKWYRLTGTVDQLVTALVIKSE